MKFYSFLQRHVKGFLFFLFNIKVAHPENEPEKTPFIVCANHISNADTVVLAAALEHQLRFFAKAELFRVPLLSSLIRCLGAFPVKRGTADVSAIKTTLKILEGGEAVAIYPQGTRCPGVDIRSTSPKPGVGMIAYRSGVPVLPVYMKTKKNRLRLFRRITVRVGAPIANSELGFVSGTKSEYEHAAELIFNRIAALSDETEGE